MSDTPKTDAEVEHPLNVMSDWYRAERLGKTEGDYPQVVAADFARRLERELASKTGSDIHSCHANCQRPLCRVRRKLDEARELATNYRDLFATLRNEVGVEAHPLPWEKG